MRKLKGIVEEMELGIECIPRADGRDENQEKQTWARGGGGEGSSIKFTEVAIATNYLSVGEPTQKSLGGTYTHVKYSAHSTHTVPGCL